MGSELTTRRSVLSASGAALAGSAFGLGTAKGQDSRTVQIGVHEVDGTFRFGKTKHAIKKLDGQVAAVDFSCHEGTSVQYDDKYDTESTVEGLEKSLQDEGELGQYDIHVFTHTMRYGPQMDGAGFNVWELGKQNRGNGAHEALHIDDDFTREYEEVGNYAFVFVNDFYMDHTELFFESLFSETHPVLSRLDRLFNPKDYFKNTVIHEIGHCFGADHEDGTIDKRSWSTSHPWRRDQAVSPMCTWYVEDWVGIADKLDIEEQDIVSQSALCDADGHNPTKHTQQLSSCTKDQIARHACEYVFDDFDCDDPVDIPDPLDVL